MRDTEIPVLIVGGSLVGLSAAALLADQGIQCLAVERHSGTAIHPRAAHATQRTMEIFRGLGIEGRILERSSEQFVQNGGVVAVETLKGGATTEFIADLNQGIRDVSPCERIFLSQNSLEPILAQRASELGATLKFATEVVSVEHQSGQVLTVLRDRATGTLSRVRSQYVIAADGAHSGVRHQLHIGMSGRPAFSRSITIYFRANLRGMLAGKQWAVVYVNNPRLRGFFRFEKPFDSAFLVVNTEGDPAHPATDVSTDLTDARVLEYVHTALGTEDIPVTIDAVMHWEAAAQVAESLQSGHIFLAGDAAHVMPPTGGFGGNTGVQDAHNLVWKLAAVLKGDGAPGLLQTYAKERHPVANLSVEQAYTRYVRRTDPSLGSDHCQPLVHDLNIELGYQYRSGAVVTEMPDDGKFHLNPRESLGRPGTRAPHMWLERRGQKISSLDLYGRRFVLLAGPEATAWATAARSAFEPERSMVEILQPGVNDLQDPSGDLSSRHGIEPDGCVLVRPDGFVAWRARSSQGASESELNSSLLRVCGRCSEKAA